MGKMIDAQSIVVATASTGQTGQEGRILRFVFWHSVALAAIMGVIVMLQAYVFPVDDPEVRRLASVRARGSVLVPGRRPRLATDYLQFIQPSFRLDRAMAPLVRRAARGERDDATSSICVPADRARCCCSSRISPPPACRFTRR